VTIGAETVYKVEFYKGSYSERQHAANEDRCVAYVEQHFNSSDSPEPSYAVVITGSNASKKSRDWGRWYAKAIAKEFNTRTGGDEGIQPGGFGGRGDANLILTRMPAILLEPLFASNPQQAELIRSEHGQERLARVLCESIQEYFPDGGLIGFSVGHKYRTDRRHDLGAPLHGGGMEADFAEIVLRRAEAMLTGVGASVPELTIRVVRDDNDLFTASVAADEKISWDPASRTLRISRGALAART
jgi:hypothetical protein